MLVIVGYLFLLLLVYVIFFILLFFIIFSMLLVGGEIDFFSLLCLFIISFWIWVWVVNKVEKVGF